MFDKKTFYQLVGIDVLRCIPYTIETNKFFNALSSFVVFILNVYAKKDRPLHKNLDANQDLGFLAPLNKFGRYVCGIKYHHLRRIILNPKCEVELILVPAATLKLMMRLQKSFSDEYHSNESG